MICLSSTTFLATESPRPSTETKGSLIFPSSTKNVSASEKEYFYNMPKEGTYSFQDIVPKVSDRERKKLGVFRGVLYFAKK